MLQKAVFYPELTQGPKNCGEAYWLRARDGVRLRAAIWRRKDKVKGSILLLPGRFGYVERFGRVAKTFHDQGFTTLALEWRSQGLSDRSIKDRQKGHVRSFSDYQHDIVAMFAAAECLNLPKPWHLVAISMGGCVALRAAIKGLPVSSIAFLVPMWGIKLSFWKRAAAWPVCGLAQFAGFGGLYAPGESSEPYVLNTQFENNNLTHDKDNYNFWITQARAAPELAIGGPTCNWVYQSLVECKSLSKQESPKMRCMTLSAELDDLVDNDAIKDRMSRWPNSEFFMMKNARHDVLSEVPDVRAEVIGKLTNFFSRTD